MRRVPYFLVPFIPVGLIMAMLFVFGQKDQLPAGAQSQLNEYRLASSPGASVQAAVRAGRPWAYEATMSRLTFSTDSYFRTSAGHDAEGSTRPLPFPPQELWCVQLSSDEASPSGVVLAGAHADLYVSRWIVHEPAPAPTSAKVQTMLEEIGCALP